MLQFIFKEASPNAIVEINSPPHALALSCPLSGVDYDKHERSGLLNPSTGILAIFLERISSNAFIPAHQYGKYM